MALVIILSCMIWATVVWHCGNVAAEHRYTHVTETSEVERNNTQVEQPKIEKAELGDWKALQYDSTKGEGQVGVWEYTFEGKHYLYFMSNRGNVIIEHKTP